MFAGQRLLAERAAALEAERRALEARIADLVDQVAYLREELRRAQIAAQQVVNSTFAVMRVPPPHVNAPRPPRGPMGPIARPSSWEDARRELEKRELPKEEEKPSA